MALTLRVSGYHAQTLGSTATRIFQSGGTIGRAPGNDWVLPDPEKIVSGRHAVISLEGGGYVLTDHSTNGTIVNGRALPQGGKARLNTGDVLTLGHYEIAVSVQESPGQALSAGGHAVDPEPLDPLKFFDPAPAPPRREAGAMADHDEPQRHVFTPPNVRREAPPLPPAPRDVPSEPAPSFRDTGVIPENWDDPEIVDPPLPPPRRVAPPPPPPPPPPRPPPARPAPPPAPPRVEVEPLSAEPAVSGLAAGAGPASAGPAAVNDMRALFRALGIDAAPVDAATAESLAQILRVVVGGLLDVLRARAEIKNQFRVTMTTLKPEENNPLKFSASADDALFNLFGRRNPTFKAPADAFREAFSDLKAHQIAMMAGTRAAFSAMLQKFDPEELQKVFDKGMKRSALLDVMNKTKYWDLYRDMFAEFGNDDATFRSLFGDEFAEAYEQQMQRLTAQKRT